MVFTHMLTLLAAASLHAGEVCKPCPNGTTPVSIALWSAELHSSSLWHASYDPDYFYSRPSGAKDLGSFPVRNARELRQKIIDVANSCQRIKFLLVASHGAEGYVSLPDGGIDGYNVGSTFSGLDCAMEKGATVEFGGCSVAKGCSGEDFVVEAARLLLPKGGVMKAPTWLSSGLPGTPRISLNTVEQMIAFGPGFSDPIFWAGQESGEACRDELWAEHDKIVNLKHQLDFCNYSKARADEITTFLDKLRIAARNELKRGEKRQSFDAGHGERTVNYLRAYDSADAFREKLAKTLAGMTCEPGKFPGYGPAPAAGVFKPSTVASSPPPPLPLNKPGKPAY